MVEGLVQRTLEVRLGNQDAELPLNDQNLETEGGINEIETGEVNKNDRTKIGEEEVNNSMHESLIEDYDEDYENSTNTLDDASITDITNKLKKAIQNIM